MSDKEKIRTILFDWHKWRDYYYSDLKDEVITDDEWKTTRDKIDDEAIANIQALIQEQVRLARIKDLELWIDAGRLELEAFSDTPTVALEDFIDLMETNLEALNGG